MKEASTVTFSLDMDRCCEGKHKPHSNTQGADFIDGQQAESVPRELKLSCGKWEH